MNQDKLKMIKENLGFIPPGIKVAEQISDDLADIMADYHFEVWEKEGVIPIKYKYFMAIATAVFDKNEKRARLEIKKAIDQGATKEELFEVLKQQIWMMGAPSLVMIAPLVKFINQKFESKKASTK